MCWLYHPFLEYPEMSKSCKGSEADFSDFTNDCVLDILRDINSAYANRLIHSLSVGDVVAALSVPMPDPRTYTTSLDFSKDYLAYNLLRKIDREIPGIDRAGAAVDSFIASEASCASWNINGKAFSQINPGDYTQSLEALFHGARRLIKKALKSFSWNDVSEGARFSSGASTRHARKSGSPFYKYSGKPEVTISCSDLLTTQIKLHPLWHAVVLQSSTAPGANRLRKLVVGSRASTVGKTWKTDRFICIEPDGNMYMQLGMGQLLRRRLRAVGINLNDQSYNQYLAWIGSRTGSLVTIDLASASDSIAWRLVRELLPPDWVEAIQLLRCRFTQLPDGSWHELEKVSSMGNGFTFELESLIFWALSQSVLEAYGTEDRRLAVYGDDIVIHNSVAEPLIELLAYCGFTTNAEKTFVDGPFRESCGKHYFLGDDVTPFNIKSEISSESRFYWLMNSYNSWLARNRLGFPKGAKRIYRRGRKFTKRYCVVPPGYGSDLGIETPILQASGIIWSFRHQAYLFKALRPVREVHRPNGRSALLWWMSQNKGLLPSERILELHKGETIYQRVNVKMSMWG